MTYNEAMDEARFCDRRATDNNWPADRGHWTGKAMEWRQRARAALAHRERDREVQVRASGRAALVAALAAFMIVAAPAPAHAGFGSWLSSVWSSISGLFSQGQQTGVEKWADWDDPKTIGAAETSIKINRGRKGFDEATANAAVNRMAKELSFQQGK